MYTYHSAILLPSMPFTALFLMTRTLEITKAYIKWSLDIHSMKYHTAIKVNKLELHLYHDLKKVELKKQATEYLQYENIN